MSEAQQRAAEYGPRHGGGPRNGGAQLDERAALAALDVAVRAPSIHNTQPWRWSLDAAGVLRLHADRNRQLAVADPGGHSLMVSCGAALHLTELALQAQGWEVSVEVLPDAAGSDLLAAFRVAPLDEEAAMASAGTRSAAAALAEAALNRRCDRRPFLLRDVGEQELDALRAAGDGDSWIDFPTGEDQRINLAVAVSWADREESRDEAYLAEMRAWLRDPDVHAQDGVPLESVPHIDPGHPRRLDVPQRDFEVGVSGAQIIERDVDEKPLIAVLLAAGDGPREQLLAGRSMMRLMLAAQQLGLATCPLSQAVDIDAFRARVQGLMGWVGHPQMMLRIGYPSAPLDQIPHTPRRPAGDVLDIES